MDGSTIWRLNSKKLKNTKKKLIEYKEKTDRVNTTQSSAEEEKGASCRGGEYLNCKHTLQCRN